MSRLTPAQREHFDREGYLVVEDVLDPELDIAPIWDEYWGVVDEIAHGLLAEGAISSLYRDLPFEARLIRICEESGRNFSANFDFSLPQTGVTPETPLHVGPAVFGLLTSPRLLDIVEEFIGPEIYSNPVQHIRMKLPQQAVAKGSEDGLATRIPWHQDNGVILPEADDSQILTVWMPITRATVENGCLQVIPRSHRNDLLQHCPVPQKGVGIPDTLLPEGQAVPLEMKPGSALFMTSRTVHSSLDNLTDDQVRISLDLRYQPIGQPTGRPAFPGFVARSAAFPEAELHNPDEWARLWYETRAKLAQQDNPSFNRWSSDAAVCA